MQFEDQAAIELAKVGDFRLLRQLGCGQCGIVFEVALKRRYAERFRLNHIEKHYALKASFNFGQATRALEASFENEALMRHPDVRGWECRYIAKCWNSFTDIINDDVLAYLPDFAREQAYCDDGRIVRRQTCYIVLDYVPMTLNDWRVSMNDDFPVSQELQACKMSWCATTLKMY